MADIEFDVDGNQVLGTRMLTIDEYAERVGKSARVIKRALYGEDSYMIPGAVRDAEDRWRIPENAVRVKRPAEQGPEAPTTGLQLVPPSATFPTGATGGQMVQWPPAAEAAEPTLREELDDQPGFMTIAAAAEYLGIPEKQIRSNPERFGLEAVGYAGSPRVPQRVVRRIMGY